MMLKFNCSKVQGDHQANRQVTVYNTGKNREEVESFLVLGFGGRGHDLLKSFDVKYLGNEKVDGLDTRKAGTGAQGRQRPQQR